MATRRRLDDFGFTGDTFGDMYQPPPEQQPQAQDQQYGGFQPMPVQQPAAQTAPMGYEDSMQDELAAFRGGRAQKGIETNASDADVFGSDDWKKFLAGEEGWNANSGGQAPQASAGGFESLIGQLQGLFPGGQFNQDIVNRRTENARENLNRFSKSRNDTNRAALASRGLIGDGPEQTAQNLAESDIADRYANAVSGIYADESGRADDRMMDAFGLAAGMNRDQGRLDLDRMLGTGNLALQNAGMTNDYNLDLARFGLDRDKTLWDMENDPIDQLMQLIGLWGQGAGNASGGYI